MNHAALIDGDVLPRRARWKLLRVQNGRAVGAQFGHEVRRRPMPVSHTLSELSRLIAFATGGWKVPSAAAQIVVASRTQLRGES